MISLQGDALPSDAREAYDAVRKTEDERGREVLPNVDDDYTRPTDLTKCIHSEHASMFLTKRTTLPVTMSLKRRKPDKVVSIREYYDDWIARCCRIRLVGHSS
jgi:hypothetical protein